MLVNVLFASCMSVGGCISVKVTCVSKHLATRGNNKLLRTPPHICSSEERLSRLTRRTFAQLRTNKSPSLKSYLHKVNAKHFHLYYAPSVTSTHMTHIISSTAPTYLPHCPGFVDRPRRSNCIAGQMDGEAGWWTTSGNVGQTPLARVMGVGRQQQRYNHFNSIRCYIHTFVISEVLLAMLNSYGIYITTCPIGN